MNNLNNYENKNLGNNKKGKEELSDLKRMTAH